MSVETTFSNVLGIITGSMASALYYNLYYGAPSYIIALNGIFVGVLGVMSFGICLYKPKEAPKK